MKLTMRVSGLRELDVALGELPKATSRNVGRRVLMKAGQPIADAAARLAPDDPATGGKDLKSSIVVGTKLTRRQASSHRKKTKNDKAFSEAFVGTKDPAAVQQEFGNERHGPQSFMRPAWDQEKGAALDIVKAELGAEISKAAKRLARRAAKKAG
ncbi:HK97-gp10 family putative phage morphogenesis protein [Devosia sp. 2618]|uniref:HK97-gp10 family putative phage morphogenesis protein n=1 Tax=Devosia sp. 2618 TaxID=3156454 RepID=UPI003398C4B3